MSDVTGSITRLLQPLRAGDPAAQDAAFRRLWGPTLAVARRRPSHSPMADGEDVAIQALQQLLEGFERGSYPGVRHRGELFALLWEIVVRRVVSERRRATADRRDARRDRPMEDGAEPVSAAPPPDELIAARDWMQRLFELLEKSGVRLVVEESIAGWTNAEIASHLHCSVRTVDRKLALARSLLQSEVTDG